MIEASLVIATYNRSRYLRACLERLTQQTEPSSSYEVVVVDDGSTDDTRAVLSKMATPYRLRVVTQENRGQAAALNHGAQIADGRVCLFLDDDIAVAPRFLSEHLALHRARLGVVGIGHMTLSLPSGAGWFEQGFARDWRAHYAELNGARRAGWQDCYGGNMSVARSAFLEAGGFDPELARGYDVGLAYRLAGAGCEFVYLPAALSDQYQLKRYAELTRDSELAGASAVELYRRYPDLLSAFLGAFGEQRYGVATALRLLLALDLPPGRLRSIGSVFRLFLGSDTAYQILHRYSFWRGVRHGWGDPEAWRYLTGGTPILMYHAFGAPGERASRYVTPVDRFARQMAWLKRAGYRFLSLEDLLSFRATHRLPPARAVVVTVDDGYADVRDVAQPVLRRYGIPATVFLVTDRVGGTNDWDPRGELAGRALLSWAAVRLLRQDGLHIGAHTRTHPDVTVVPSTRAEAEIGGSRAVLEAELGEPVRAFAYPYGKSSPAAASLVARSGFDVACGIDGGLNTAVTPLHALRRVEVHGTDSLLEFALTVRFGMRLEAVGKRYLQMAGALRP